MSDRSVLHHLLSATSILALLLSAVTSQIRSFHPVDAFSGIASPPYHLAVPPVHANRLSLSTAAMRAAPVKAVRSENDEEEELNRITHPVSPFLLLVPAIIFKISPKQTPCPSLVSTSHPMRC